MGAGMYSSAMVVIIACLGETRIVAFVKMAFPLIILGSGKQFKWPKTILEQDN